MLKDKFGSAPRFLCLFYSIVFYQQRDVVDKKQLSRINIRSDARRPGATTSHDVRRTRHTRGHGKFTIFAAPSSH